MELEVGIAVGHVEKYSIHSSQCPRKLDFAKSKRLVLHEACILETQALVVDFVDHVAGPNTKTLQNAERHFFPIFYLRLCS